MKGWELLGAHPAIEEEHVGQNLVHGADSPQRLLLQQHVVLRNPQGKHGLWEEHHLPKQRVGLSDLGAGLRGAPVANVLLHAVHIYPPLLQQLFHAHFRDILQDGVPGVKSMATQIICLRPVLPHAQSPPRWPHAFI